MVIDSVKREIRFEREKPMRDMNNVKTETKFPETLNIEEGTSFVLLGKEVRNGVKTRYGDRTVVECIERVTKQRVSVWWPNGLALPSLTFPFILNRINKRDWRVVTCDTREEAVELWKTGKVENPKMTSDDSSADFS